jgi:tripartite-type tricarboxylate transporter receptor subunit TctC
MAWKIRRRQFLHLAVGTVVLPAICRNASAFHYPNRPVRLLVGFAAGGPLDTGARLIAEWLSERLGQSFIIENRPGASGNLAAEEVVRAAPDGYTLLECAAANAWNTSLYRSLSFDFARDLAPVASVTRNGGVMEVNLSVPAKTVPEFIAFAKANPGKVNMASAGPGSAPGMWGELFKVMADLDLTTVNYRGSAPALPDLIAGRVQVMFDVAITAIGPVKAGKVRALAVTTKNRLNAMPDIPTLDEFVPGYEGVGWQGISAPKDTPPEIIGILNREVNAALADPAFKAKLTALGGEPLAMSPEKFGKFIVEFTEKWAKVIHQTGIKVE